MDPVHPQPCRLSPTASAARSCSSGCATQAQKYGARIETDRVTKLERDDETGLFTATWGSGCVTARTVLLATGVTNRRPPMDEELHDDALARGLIRYCPICDGYEVTDKKVGVIGSDKARRRRGDVPARLHRRRHPDRPRQGDAGLGRGPGEAEGGGDRLRRRAGAGASRSPTDHIVVDTAEGHYTFDSVYPALGSDTHVQLAEMLGARPQRQTAASRSTATSGPASPGLYAAGDVVIGLDQISHAMGEGGVAATTIRNDLAKQSRCCASHATAA